ncbi:hypothetical protein Ahy_A04g018215 [Arachis hypogaea]|uniref:Uncharacterized protein n=1 Tax=Arachis hypogaea TaxID=3818 RepID=A0A445DD61_ARAHY|nr:hypothetical protein Ahy_A04g018215 [Arachis hypogaea]
MSRVKNLIYNNLFNDQISKSLPHHFKESFESKFTGQRSGITFCQRIGADLVLFVLNMVFSGFIETKRIGVCIQHNLMENPKTYVPINIWWLLPQYVISGTSNALTVIGF